MKFRVFKIILIGMILSGCTGVHFAEAPVNAVFPDSFAKRSTYPSSVTAYEFQELVGSIISVEPGKDLIRVGIVRSNESTPSVIPITDSLNYYHSKIQQGALANGDYLAFAAKLSTDDMVDLELDDIARASTDYNDEVISKLSEWVKAHPKPNANIRRIWVKSVVLTRQSITNYVKITANASGQIGEVTGVKTGVYRKSENSTRSTIIGFDAFDIDQLVNSYHEISQNITTRLEYSRSVDTYKGKNIVIN